MKSLRSSVQAQKGGARETAGRKPRGLRKIDVGSGTRCVKCGVFVARTNYHVCKTVRPYSRKAKPEPFRLPGMPPDCME